MSQRLLLTRMLLCLVGGGGEGGDGGERLVGSCILPSDLVSGERSSPKINYSII